MLTKIRDAFCERELAFVGLALQNEGSLTQKAIGGSFMETDIEQEKRSVNPRSIACVRGFLLNMVDKTVELISPCRATEINPLGYIVCERRKFNDGEELRSCLYRICPLGQESEAS
jgi:hypothetical protein